MAEYLHKVQQGETVLTICVAWDLTYEEFMELNRDFGLTGHRYGCDVIVGEYVVVGHTTRVLDKIRIQEKRRQR